LYLQYGLMALNGLNPYLTPSANFASVLSPFIFWNQTSTYGPISQIFWIISAAFVPISPILGVYIFKLICLIFHIFNSYLIWQELKFNNYRQRVAIAYLLNPLLLFELVTEAHVDVFVCTIIILATTAIKKRQYVLGILSIWLGPAITILLFGRKIRQFPQFEKWLRGKGLFSTTRRIPN
jgi:alpha-1,6-mannosyltransferase